MAFQMPSDPIEDLHDAARRKTEGLEVLLSPEDLAQVLRWIEDEITQDLASEPS